MSALAGIATPVTLQATDAANDPLTYSIVTQPAHGVLTGTAPNLNYTATAGYAGQDAFTFKVNDGKVDSNIATVTITVQRPNAVPVASPQALSATAGVAEPVTLQATDADNDPLTYSIVAQPAHGVLTGTAPNLNYTASAGYVGQDSFTFKVNDGEDDSNVATITITVASGNIPPVAYNISVVTTMDKQAYPTLIGTDADGDPLTYTIISKPDHGGAWVRGTVGGPYFTYAPNKSYIGPDSFTYKVNDGVSDSNIATVTITVKAP